MLNYFSLYFIFIEKIVLTAHAVPHVVDVTEEVDVIPTEEEPPAIVPVAVKTELLMNSIGFLL